MTPVPGQVPIHHPPTSPDRRLRYPRRSLVLLGGLPGTGKTTLLNRVFGLTGDETATARSADGVRVVDSQQSRNRLTPALRPLPYDSWRWVVHTLHYLRIVRALRTGDPVIAHVTATRPLVMRLIGTYCRMRGVEVHLLLVDADPDEALRSQVARGRRISDRNHHTHVRRWRRLLAACSDGPRAVMPGARSLRVMRRPIARRITEISFTSGPARPVSRR